MGFPRTPYDGNLKHNFDRVGLFSLSDPAILQLGVKYKGRNRLLGNQCISVFDLLPYLGVLKV
jgi:hypothetical protein